MTLPLRNSSPTPKLRNRRRARGLSLDPRARPAGGDSRGGSRTHRRARCSEAYGRAAQKTEGAPDRRAPRVRRSRFRQPSGKGRPTPLGARCLGGTPTAAGGPRSAPVVGWRDDGDRPRREGAPRSPDADTGCEAHRSVLRPSRRPETRPYDRGGEHGRGYACGRHVLDSGAPLRWLAWPAPSEARRAGDADSSPASLTRPFIRPRDLRDTNARGVDGAGVGSAAHHPRGDSVARPQPTRGPEGLTGVILFM